MSEQPILNQNDSELPEAEIRLDDEKRIRVLSPGLLIWRRFVRNKLAIAGMVILIVMFAFSFIGGRRGRRRRRRRRRGGPRPAPAPR